MRELQEEGSVRHVGVSNFPPAMVEEATQHAEIFCNQVEYHPYRAQEELLKQAKEMDYLLTAYSPVAGGGAGKEAKPPEIGKAYGKTAPAGSPGRPIQTEKVASLHQGTR